MFTSNDHVCVILHMLTHVCTLYIPGLQLGLNQFCNDFLNLVFLDTDLLAKTLPGADSLDSSKKLRMTQTPNQHGLFSPTFCNFLRPHQGKKYHLANEILKIVNIYKVSILRTIFTSDPTSLSKEALSSWPCTLGLN